MHGHPCPTASSPCSRLGMQSAAGHAACIPPADVSPGTGRRHLRAAPGGSGRGGARCRQRHCRGSRPPAPSGRPCRWKWTPPWLGAGPKRPGSIPTSPHLISLSGTSGARHVRKALLRTLVYCPRLHQDRSHTQTCTRFSRFILSKRSWLHEKQILNRRTGKGCGARTWGP